MVHVQGFCLVFELGQPLGQVGVRGGQYAHAYEGAHDLDVHGDCARASTEDSMATPCSVKT